MAANVYSLLLNRAVRSNSAALREVGFLYGFGAPLFFTCFDYMALL
jgi:hypothetical protein